MLLRLSIITGIIGGLVVLALKPIVLDYASLTPKALDYLNFMMIINSYYISGTSVNTCLIGGVFPEQVVIVSLDSYVILSICGAMRYHLASLRLLFLSFPSR